MKLTDIDIGEKKGIFVIAAPSTWPPFAAKMSQLIELLEKIKPDFHIVFIYIREAHADDVWPLCFKINSAKNLEEK